MAGLATDTTEPRTRPTPLGWTPIFLFNSLLHLNHTLFFHYLPGLASINGPSILKTRFFCPPSLRKCRVGLLQCLHLGLQQVDKMGKRLHSFRKLVDSG